MPDPSPLDEPSSRARAPKQTGSNGAGRPSDPAPGLLRFAHIFASTVREVLELEVLREVSPEPLSLSQFQLLKLVCANGHHQVGQVADFLGVSPPAASKNIDKMERMGLVAREPSPVDRRVTLLRARVAGREMVDRYESLKAARLAPVLAGFDAAELDQLERLLERFSLGLLEREDGDDSVCLRCSAYYDPACPVRRIRSGCPYQKGRQGRLAEAGAGAA